MVRERAARTTTTTTTTRGRGGRGVRCATMLLALTVTSRSSVRPVRAFLAFRPTTTTTTSPPISTRRPFASRLWSSSSSSSSLSTDERADLEAAVRAKGDEIRSLKESGADKDAVAPLVAQLLELKAKLDPEAAARQEEKKRKNQQRNRQQPKQQQKQKQKQKQTSDDSSSSSDRITPRGENFSKWYNDLVRVAGLADDSPVRGCMVIKPWGMALWDAVRRDLDERIAERGAENAYFPLLVPQSFLSREADHVEGFAKECAVVTHHRLATDPKTGRLAADPAAELEEPLVIRPTSETVIWSTFKKWITSHRDLPLKINQWANVLRWELRTRPFLRTSEFLWQEGHTAHADAEEASAEARDMMEVYADMCRETLALPVVRGVKSPSERFAGADETYTIEALMANGWALQSGTSHFLGRSFAKAFDVTFADVDGVEREVWGTSWGVSTRLLGALVMTHSDDAGLVLPPRVAPKQVALVPVVSAATDDDDRARVAHATRALADDLRRAGVRVRIDDRDHVRPGAKYFEWERKGVPLRVEIGPRDVDDNSCVFAYRVGDVDKITVSLDDAAAEAVAGLERTQSYLYDAAAERLARGVTTGATYDDMRAALENDEAGSYPGAGLFLVPWKCDAANENKIKEECKATVRCYPLEDNKEGMVDGKKCFYCGEDATHMALFGRAF